MSKSFNEKLIHSNSDYPYITSADEIEYVYQTATNLKDALALISAKSGVTPLLRVKDGYWEVSYDNGTTWQQILDSDNNPVPATGDKGDSGDSGTTLDYMKTYYLATAAASGVTKDTSGWSEDSSSQTISKDIPYLWSYTKYVYKDPVYEYNSTPVIIRYFNSEATVSEEQIETAVTAVVGNRLTKAEERLDDAEDVLNGVTETSANFWTTNKTGIINGITTYVNTDTGAKGFANLIIGQGTVTNWAATSTEDTECSVQSMLNSITGVLGNYADYKDEKGNITTVTSELDAINGTIENNVVKDNGDGTWSCGANTITVDEVNTSVARGTYVWKADDSSTTPQYVVYNGEESKEGYSKVYIADSLSSIDQTASQISLLVKDGKASADLIVSAINGGTVSIDANHIILNGETVANSLKAYSLSSNSGQWLLDATGKGFLAGGNISWDASGNTTIQGDVTINSDVTINGVLHIADDDTSDITKIKCMAAADYSSADANTDTLYILW